jgi:FlaA1/EpsC-like NDP-sugar epimerase
MKNIIRSRNFYLILLGDACLVVVANFLAYFLRFEGAIPQQEWMNLRMTVPYFVILKLIIFLSFGLYKGMWRYTGLVDLLGVLKASAASSGIIIVMILLIYRFEGFPRSVFILDWILTFFFVGGVRILLRLLLAEQAKGIPSVRQFFGFGNGKTPSRRTKRLLIIGAGNAGEKMLREIKDNPRLNYEVVGFLDDNPKKKGMNIHGVPVLGPVAKIHKLAFDAEMDEILIAVPSASTKQMRKIVQACEATGQKTRTTPGIGELIDGKISFKSIREVSFEDILGRDPVNLDTGSIGEYLAGKVVLVTGAAGSIGSELCRQIAQFSPGNLVLLDKTENSLFHLEMEFRQRFPKVPITPVLGDIKYKAHLSRLFSNTNPQVVFHAAAFKHVPIVELNPWEGVTNNIIGTRNVVETAREFSAERFIMVSTDKAVRPANVMGASKRVAEMITCAYAKSNPARFVSVRFGNVIGSEGSVIHLFKKQIERLGPVTVTHPEITRYFMTIPEACKLILQAGALGEGGEIFILDMGTPIKIVDMARDLIRKSGFKPDVDIEIKFTGLRPGEKLYEELITEGEGIVRTDNEKIFVIKGNGYDINRLNHSIEELAELAHRQNANGIKSKLKEIIPEYQPSVNENKPATGSNSDCRSDFEAMSSKEEQTSRYFIPSLSH